MLSKRFIIAKLDRFHEINLIHEKARIHILLQDLLKYGKNKE